MSTTKDNNTPATSGNPSYLDFITPDEIFDKGPAAVKEWQEAKVSALLSKQEGEEA